MSNDLTDIPNVGPSRAETLRDAGFETKAEVEDASKEELAEVNGIGPTTAAAIDAGEISHQHGQEESKLPEKREALLEAASTSAFVSKPASRSVSARDGPTFGMSVRSLLIAVAHFLDLLIRLEEGHQLGRLDAVVRAQNCETEHRDPRHIAAECQTVGGEADDPGVDEQRPEDG